MRRFALAFASLGIALVPILNAAPASAQLDHTYVSRTGSGSTCSFAAPCSSINAAIAATNTDGDVSILNGDYAENVVIDRAIGISGESTDNIIIRATTPTIRPLSPSMHPATQTVLEQSEHLRRPTGSRSLAGDPISPEEPVSKALEYRSTPSQCRRVNGPTLLTMSNASVGGSNGNILIKPSGGVAHNGFPRRQIGTRQPASEDDTGGGGTRGPAPAANAHQSTVIAVGARAASVAWGINPQPKTMPYTAPCRLARTPP